MQFGSAPLFLLLFLFLDRKHSKKKWKKMLLLWLHPLVIQLMMVHIKVFLQVAELEKIAGEFR